MPDSGNEVTEEPLDVVRADRDAVSFDFRDELFRVKTVLRRVVKERPVRPAIEGLASDLLEEEPPAGSEHAGDLRDRTFPLGHVMNNSEVEYRVE